MRILASGLLILLALISIKSKGASFRQAPLMSISIFTLTILYFFGGWIWNKVRIEAGPGYLGFIAADESLTNAFRDVLGPIVIAICLPYVFYFHSKTKVYRKSTIENQNSLASNTFYNLIILVPFFISILGEGTSILLRKNYLDSNGFLLFLRLSGITNLVGIGFLTSIFFFRKCKMKSWEFLALLSWFILLLGKGSRSSLVPLLIIFLIFLLSVSTWRSRFLMILAFLIVLKYVTGIVYLSRTHMHGVLFIPSNFLLQFNSPLATNNGFFSSFSIFIAALFTTVVTVPLSIGSLNLRGIMSNANPLISNISSFSYDVTSNGIERIFPYTWAPTSSAGTLFGVIGGFGLFAIFFVMASANIFCLSNLTWKASGVFFRLADICFFAQIFFFLEYSSRIWFRVFWSFWLCAAVGFLLLFIEKYLVKK